MHFFVSENSNTNDWFSTYHTFINISKYELLCSELYSCITFRQSQRPKTDTTRENPAPSQLPPNDPNIAGAPTILVPQSQTPADFHPQIEPDLKILQMLGGGSGGQVYK